MRDDNYQISEGLHIPEKSKTLGLRLREEELAALNQRFKIDGLSSLSDLVGRYLNGRAAKAKGQSRASSIFNWDTVKSSGDC